MFVEQKTGQRFAFRVNNPIFPNGFFLVKHFFQLHFLARISGGENFDNQIRRTDATSRVEFVFVANDADVGLDYRENFLVGAFGFGFVVKPNVERGRLGIAFVFAEIAEKIATDYPRNALMPPVWRSHFQDFAFDEFDRLLEFPSQIVCVSVGFAAVELRQIHDFAHWNSDFMPQK